MITEKDAYSMTRDEIFRIFRNPPQLYTTRLCLRKILKSDTADMFEYSCREDVTKYLLWSPHQSEAYTAKYLSYIQSRYRAGDFYDWAIVHEESGKMIGTCGFTKLNVESNSGEVGYVLNPDFWGKGYATEAVRAVIRFGFNHLRLNRLEARFMVGNDASFRVMQKVGMTYEGINRESIFVKGNYVSVGVCSILRNEYFGNSI